MRCLYEEFRRYRGQEVEIFTRDGRKFRGVDVENDDECVRIVDRCGRVILIEFCHIDAVVEPQMKVRCCREKDECEESREDMHRDGYYDDRW